MSFNVITSWRRIFMWIITCDGRAVNSDYVTSIENYGGGTYANVIGAVRGIPISRKQAITEELVREIISNTPVVDYRGEEHGY